MINSKIISYAICAHEQAGKRYDGKPYGVHLALAVAYGVEYLSLVPGPWQNTVIDSLWLHDVREDCGKTYADILVIAGRHVADIVNAVSHNETIPADSRAYYNAIRLTPYAPFVKLCDRLANVSYSVENHSKQMWRRYREENARFVEHVFNGDVTRNIYAPMIQELNSLLQLD